MARAGTQIWPLSISVLIFYDAAFNENSLDTLALKLPSIFFYCVSFLVYI